jgi:polysaccharide pyruvyl transferase WcaK-like protein
MSATTDFFTTTDLEGAMIVGYYGGGNYGDELLLEVIQNLLQPKGYRRIRVAFQNPQNFQTYHHDFGHELVDMRRPLLFAKKLLSSRSVVVGGGGLWGMDANPNIVALGLLLFLYRYVFFKKVYLVGVGYYGSTNTFGKIGAWLAGKAASSIIARDAESVQHFSRLQSHVSQDQDLAWLARELDLSGYQDDADAIEARLSIRSKTLLITLRHFRGATAEHYHATIEAFLASNQDKQIVIALLQPAESYPEGENIAKVWAQKYTNVQVLEGVFNPLGLFVFLQRHRQDVALVAPQFHAMLSAALVDMPFLPVAYDNKVFELFSQLHIGDGIHIHNLIPNDIQRFADTFFAAEPVTAAEGIGV